MDEKLTQLLQGARSNPEQQLVLADYLLCSDKLLDRKRGELLSLELAIEKKKTLELHAKRAVLYRELEQPLVQEFTQRFPKFYVAELFGGFPFRIGNTFQKKSYTSVIDFQNLFNDSLSSLTSYIHLDGFIASYFKQIERGFQKPSEKDLAELEKRWKVTSCSDGYPANFCRIGSGETFKIPEDYRGPCNG